MTYLLAVLVILALLGAFGIALLIYGASLSEDPPHSPEEPL